MATYQQIVRDLAAARAASEGQFRFLEHVAIGRHVHGSAQARVGYQSLSPELRRRLRDLLLHVSNGGRITRPAVLGELLFYKLQPHERQFWREAIQHALEIERLRQSSPSQQRQRQLARPGALLAKLKARSGALLTK